MHVFEDKPADRLLPIKPAPPVISTFIEGRGLRGGVAFSLRMRPSILEHHRWS